jgi:hypothetical protein
MKKEEEKEVAKIGTPTVYYTFYYLYKIFLFTYDYHHQVSLDVGTEQKSIWNN